MWGWQDIRSSTCMTHAPAEKALCSERRNLPRNRGKNSPRTRLLKEGVSGCRIWPNIRKKILMFLSVLLLNATYKWKVILKKKSIKYVPAYQNGLAWSNFNPWTAPSRLLIHQFGSQIQNYMTWKLSGKEEHC